MPTINIASLGDDPALEDVIDAYERMRKELEWLLNKNIDTKNAREISGWLIRTDEIVSNDRDVGLSTADDGDDPIRFWAGDAKEGSPNFTVTKAGILTAVAALLMSAAGYPRIELNSGGNLLKASKSETDFIKMLPDFIGSPTFIFDNGSSTANIGNVGSLFWIHQILGNMLIESNEDLELKAAGQVKLQAWSNMYSKGDNVTLKQELDAIKSRLSALETP